MAIRNTITPSFVQIEHVIAAVRLPAHVGNVGVSGQQAAGEEDEEKRRTSESRSWCACARCCGAIPGARRAEEAEIVDIEVVDLPSVSRRRF